MPAPARSTRHCQGISAVAPATTRSFRPWSGRRPKPEIQQLSRRGNISMVPTLRTREPEENSSMADRKTRLIGTPFRRVDGRAKVTGSTRFADDLTFPRLCWARLVRSTVPHASVGGIEFSRAREHPGFLGELTGQEIPETFGILPVSQDEHALCTTRVRFVGDPVAAVAATSEEAAYEAALQVQVDYEPLTTISSVEDALAHPEPRDPRVRRRGEYPQEGLPAVRRSGPRDGRGRPDSGRHACSTRAAITWPWSSTPWWRSPRTRTGLPSTPRPRHPTMCIGP